MAKDVKTGDNIINALNQAKKELKDYPIMPEHYSTVLKHPNLNATGFYSELDFEIGARLKRCDTFIKNKGILDKAMYDYVHREIDIKGAELKKKVDWISRQHRLYTRAARICEDSEARQKILDKAEELKQSKELKDYNLLITGLEYYAGVKEGKIPNECLDALEKHIGYCTDGIVVKPAQDTSKRLKERPSKIKIEMGNMDRFVEQIEKSHPGFRGKSSVENQLAAKRVFDKTVKLYAKDACGDVLDACVSDKEERLDFLIINGQTLREMIEEKTGKKQPTKEEIDDLSCEYVAAALKSGGRVEAFAPHLITEGTKIYRPNPVVIEGTKPQERITLNFWESWMSKLGFYKEKLEKFKAQQAMDRKMEECRERVRRKITYAPKTMAEVKEAIAKGKMKRTLDNALTPKQKKEQVFRQNLMEKYKDDYIKSVRMRETINWQRDKLLYSFFPKERDEKEGVKLESKNPEVPQLLRSAPLYYVVAAMLKEDYSLDKVMDPNQFADVRERIGNDFREKFAVMTKEEFTKLHIDSMTILAKEMPKMIKGMSQEIKTKEDFREKYPKYFVIATCMNGLQMDRMTTPEAVAYGGGEKAYDALVTQLREANSIFGLKSKYDAVYRNFHKVLDGGSVSVADLMKVNLHEEVILKGLREKEPHLSPKLLENDTLLMENNLQHHPEVIKCQKKVDRLDEKAIDSVLRNQGSSILDMKIEVYGKAMKNTKEFGNMEIGEELGMNVVINGQNMVQVQEPELEEEKTL